MATNGGTCAELRYFLIDLLSPHHVYPEAKSRTVSSLTVHPTSVRFAVSFRDTLCRLWAFVATYFI